MDKKLVAAITKVLAGDSTIIDSRLRESGNVKSKVQSKDFDKVLELADASYALPVSGQKHLMIFQQGITLGRTALQKMLMRVRLPNYVLYFMGSEADVLRKLDTLPDKPGGDVGDDSGPTNTEEETE